MDHGLIPVGSLGFDDMHTEIARPVDEMLEALVKAWGYIEVAHNQYARDGPWTVRDNTDEGFLEGDNVYYAPTPTEAIRAAYDSLKGDPKCPLTH